jgi:regulator of nonsense transcripts 2
MTRYSSIEEVNAALIELEEHEHAVSTDKANNEKHSDSENPPIRTTSNSISANGQSIVNGAEENGLVHDDIGDSDSDSGSGSTEPGGHDDEDLDEENHDGGCDSEDEDDDDGGGPASDDDDEVHVRQTVAEVDPQEEASFELELRAVMQV